VKFLEGQLVSGPIEKRIKSAVEARIMTYIQTMHVEKATHALLWRSKFMQENYRRAQDMLRKDLVRILPEIKKIKAENREVIDGVTSFEFFERLQMHQNLSEKACKKLIINLVCEQLSVS